MKLVEDVLKKLLDVSIITFPKSTQEDPNVPKIQWYREGEYCNFHHQRGHGKNKYQHLRSLIKILIDDGQVSTRAPQAPPNQDLGVYHNSLPRHDNNVNQVSSLASSSR